MKPAGRIQSILLLLLLVAFATRAQYTAQIGLTLFQATTTNLNGAGITVAQPEANLTEGATNAPTFEVNPANAISSATLITYISSNGIATAFPNVVGFESGHADGVANNFYGEPNGVATNVAQVYNYDADYYLGAFVFNMLAASNEVIINQSFTFGPLDPTNQIQVDSAYDDYEETYGTLFVSAAANSGTVAAPGTAYNCISVGAYTTPTYHNAIGPTVDNGRCKPDITAISGATSFSTPQVSGAAAVLMQAALRGDGGPDTNSAFNLRTVKALLLNGAVKPPGWTNSPLSPLDARHGAGVLNIFNSYRLLTGGKHPCIVSTLVPAGGQHLPTNNSGNLPVLNGWDFSTNTSSTNPPEDSICHYYFNVTNNQPGTRFTTTATLVWNRQLAQTNINNLALFLYGCATTNLVACSTSLVDNVQHLFLTNLDQGRYDLQVWKAGGTNIVSPVESYALAFQFISPQLAIAASGTNTLLTWPLYPAGFLVETTTNLTTPVWTNIDLSALTITNGVNTLPLAPAVATQFFRLRSPNL